MPSTREGSNAGVKAWQDDLEAQTATAPLLRRFGVGAQAWQALQAPRGTVEGPTELPLPTPADVVASANVVLARAAARQPPWWVVAPPLVEAVSCDAAAAEKLFARSLGTHPLERDAVRCESKIVTARVPAEGPNLLQAAAAAEAGSALEGMDPPEVAPPVASNRGVALSQNDIARLVLSVPPGRPAHGHLDPPRIIGGRPLDVRFCRGAWKILERSGPFPDYALWDYDTDLVRRLAPESRLTGLTVEGSASALSIDHDAAHLASVVMHRVLHCTCRRWRNVVQHSQCLSYAGASSACICLA
jgi:hypothetical protein